MRQQLSYFNELPFACASKYKKEITRREGEQSEQLLDEVGKSNRETRPPLKRGRIDDESQLRKMWKAKEGGKYRDRGSMKG